VAEHRVQGLSKRYAPIRNRRALARSWRNENATERLKSALEEGGSAWRVATDAAGACCLERRVDETATLAAREVVRQANRPAAHLALAWNAAFGQAPAPGTAYREAVRAVEAAALPVVLPKDPTGTLGRVIVALRDAPHKWSVVLRPAAGHDPIETLRLMLELLWKSQFDRHGTADESVPLSVTPEEGSAAVVLATTLVQWFQSGAVARNP